MLFPINIILLFREATTKSQILHDKMIRIICLLLALGNISYHSPALAKEEALPVPRFVSIKASQANIRTGPNVRYPVRWVFVRKGEPVEIIAEFEQWRKIRDKQGDDGWIHESMLSGRRQAVITGEKPQLIYRKADYASAPLAKFEPEVRVELDSCMAEWCRVEFKSYKGWIEKKYLWGVYAHEKME
jgi:SH3-like domain-containing protein